MIRVGETVKVLIEEMEEVLERTVPGVAFGFSQPIELRVAELISGVRSDVAVHIYGDDLELLSKIEGELVKVEVEEGDQVKVDFNHPLAGQTLVFEVSVVGLRQAAEAEIEHGHVHFENNHDHD